MSVYLDASVLVSFFSIDALSGRADLFFQSQQQEVVVADFAAAEFASAIARRVRMRRLSQDDARAVFADFDGWSSTAVVRVETMPVDITAAAAFLRRLDLTLRTADAINIAIAQRLGSRLATFDARMSTSADTLGVAVVEI